MIAAAWGGIRFLSSSDLFGRESCYYAHYDQISGVQKASPIYIKGVKVGNVSDIALDNDVVVTLSISSQYAIPADSKAKIFSSGIMNPKAIEIELGDSAQLLKSGDTIASNVELDLFEMAGSEMEFINDKLESVTDDMSKMLNNLSSLLDRNSTNIDSVINNVEKLSNNVNSLLESNKERLNDTLDGAAKLSQTMGDNAERIDSIIMGINTLTRDLSEMEVGAKIGESLAHLASILQTIENEEGTIGKLLSNEDLYNNLTATSADLDSLFYDIRQNPNRYVHFSVFGRSAAKEMERSRKRADKEAKAQENK